jgi:hypothetical protein
MAFQSWAFSFIGAATAQSDILVLFLARKLLPRGAIPLQGTWIGTASDHLAMKVAVKVAAAADAECGALMSAGG